MSSHPDPVSPIPVAWVKALAAHDMMAIEAVVSGVCEAQCAGLERFALFDGGAHKGYHTKRMAALPGCEAVYAVEADPSMLQTLTKDMAAARHPETGRRQFGRNAVSLHLVGKALQNDPAVDTVSWKSSTSHVGRSSISAQKTESDTIWTAREDMEYREVVSVPATTIDRVLEAETRPVPFLKLDLEGADILSLFGAKDVLSRHRPVVAFENSIHAPRVHGFSLDDFRAYLDTLGYVACDFAGERLTEPTWFSFFEAWIVPEDRAEWLSATLQAVLGGVAERVDLPSA